MVDRCRQKDRARSSGVTSVVVNPSVELLAVVLGVFGVPTFPSVHENFACQQNCILGLECWLVSYLQVNCHLCCLSVKCD